MTAPTVRFERQGTRWRVNFPYDPKLVDWCKTVPSYGRSYDPATKAWLFDRQFGEQLATEWRAAGYQIIGMEAGRERARRAPPPPPPRQIEQREGWAAELMRRCSPELRISVRRNLAKALHSDVGGNGELMAELNEALNAITKQDEQTG